MYFSEDDDIIDDSSTDSEEERRRKRKEKKRKIEKKPRKEIQWVSFYFFIIAYLVSEWNVDKSQQLSNTIKLTSPFCLFPKVTKLKKTG